MFPLRGRQRELELLLKAWRDVHAGATRFVLVAGEPGAGKTRLAQELYIELTQHYDQPQPGFSEGYWPDMLKPGLAQDSLVPPQLPANGKRPPLPYLWWALTCRQGNESQRESFQPYADGLDQLSVHLLSQLRGTLIREAWGEVAHGLVFGSMEYLPLIGPLLKGIYNPVRGLAARLRKLREPAKLDERLLERGGGAAAAAGSLEEVLIQLIAALNNPTDKRLPSVPVCLVLDDAQWADARSVAFTQRLLELAAESGWRVLVLATVRSNELAAQLARAGAGGATATTIGELVQGLLRRATPQSVVQLQLSSDLAEPAMRLLLKDQLPHASEHVLDTLQNRVGGHPYFAVNYARLIEEEGWLDADGELAAGEEALHELPDEVSAIIDRRLSLLDTERRRVLNWGSVQGWHFIDSFIERAAAKLGQEQSQALLQLDGLQRAHHLVNPLPPPPAAERLYQFAHRLIYERVRQGFDPELQEYRLVRAALGEMLREHLAAGQLTQWPAEDQFEALQILHKFASESSGADWTATRLAAAGRILELLSGRGDNVAAEPLAEQTWRELKPLLAAESPVQAAGLPLAVLPALAAVFNVRGRWDEWQRCTEQWLKLSREAGDAAGEIAALLNLAELAQMRGLYDEALLRYEEVAQAVKRAGDRTGEADTLAGMGQTYIMRADYDRAQALFDQARAIYEELGDEGGVLECREGVADVSRARIEIDESLAQYGEVLAGYRRLGDQRAEARVLRCMGIMHIYREELDAADELLTQCLDIEQRLGCESSSNETRRNLALVLARRRDFERGIEILKQGLAVARRLGDRQGEARNLHSLGTTYIRMHSFDEALPCMEQSQALYLQFGDWHTASKTLLNIGMIYSHTGHDAQALENFQKAEKAFVKAGDQFSAAVAGSCQGWSLMCLRRFDESIEAGERALALDSSPESHITYYNISAAKWLRGDSDALDHYRAGIKRFGHPPDPASLPTLVDRGLTSEEAVEQLAAELGVTLPVA